MVTVNPSVPENTGASGLSRSTRRGVVNTDSTCATQPATVSDRSDGRIAHLDGVNLSRAWALRSIAQRIGDTKLAARLGKVAEEHLAASLPHVAGDYMGEHWLASFALLALSEI